MRDARPDIISGVRWLAGGALAALGALLLTLSFPPHDLWWLVWVALVPMLLAEHRVLPAAGSALAPAIGVGGFVLGCFGGIFPERAAWYMKLLPLLVTVVVFVASRRARTRLERAGYARWPLDAATTWVAFELARLPALGTWGLLGDALYQQAWLLQPVRVFGIFGLDLLIVLVNYSIAMAVLAALDRRGSRAAPARVAPRHAAFWCAGVLVALAAWCAPGLLLRADGAVSAVRVAVLQPGLRRTDVSGPPSARDRALLDRLTAQTRAAAARGARLVVWPEAALAADPAAAYAGELGDLARAAGATLVVGYAIHTPAGVRNEAVTIDPEGRFAGRYGKNHPVGFLGGTSIWRGTYPTVDAPFGRMGSIICYDMDFTDSARILARRGARVIAVPSADWPAIAATHYTFAVFRALESGAAIAKSEYSRDSAIVDAWGRIAARTVTPAGSQAILIADLPLRDGLPLAARFGDWVGWLCAAAVAGRAAWRVSTALRARRGRASPMESEAALRPHTPLPG